jgi:hypothetical protein
LRTSQDMLPWERFSRLVSSFIQVFKARNYVILGVIDLVIIDSSHVNKISHLHQDFFASISNTSVRVFLQK